MRKPTEHNQNCVNQTRHVGSNMGRHLTQYRRWKQWAEALWEESLEEHEHVWEEENWKDLKKECPEGWKKIKEFVVSQKVENFKKEQEC